MKKIKTDIIFIIILIIIIFIVSVHYYKKNEHESFTNVINKTVPYNDCNYNQLQDDNSNHSDSCSNYINKDRYNSNNYSIDHNKYENTYFTDANKSLNLADDRQTLNLSIISDNGNLNQCRQVTEEIPSEYSNEYEEEEY